LQQLPEAPSQGTYTGALACPLDPAQPLIDLAQCDENLPSCSHCLRRGEECEMRTPIQIQLTHRPQPDVPRPASPLSGGDIGGQQVNMLHMK